MDLAAYSEPSSDRCTRALASCMDDLNFRITTDVYISLSLIFFLLLKINMTKMHVNVNARSGREGTLQGSGGRLLVVLLEVARVDRF